jgi:hypothetical protein
MNFSTARLRIASGAGILAVAGIVGQALIEPKGAEQSTAAAFAAARAHQAAWFTAGWAEIVGFSAAAFLVATVPRLVRQRGAWLVTVGAWLTTVSLLVIGLNGLSLAQGVLARQPDQSAMMRAYDDVSSSAVLVPLLTLAALSIVGPVLLAFGVRRAGLAGWWLPALSLLGVVLYVALGGGDDGGVAAVLVQVPLAGQLITYAVLLARSAAEDGAAATLGASPVSVTPDVVSATV